MPVALQNLPAADGSFSGAGAAAWNGSPVWSGLTAGQILYPSSSSALTDSANLSYAETSGPRLTVGSGSTTLAGWTLGYLGASGFAGMWNTGLTPTTANYALVQTASGGTAVNAASGQNVTLGANNSIKATVFGPAGFGMSIAAGTATGGSNAFAVTQTWNNSGVAFTGWLFTITDTASAAGSLAMQILGGAAGTTPLFSIFKDGKLGVGSSVTRGVELNVKNAAYVGFDNAAANGTAVFVRANASNECEVVTSGYATAIKLDGSSIQLNANGSTGTLTGGAGLFTANGSTVGTIGATSPGNATVQEWFTVSSPGGVRYIPCF